MEARVTFTFAASTASSDLVDCGEWRLSQLYCSGTHPGSSLSVYGWYDNSIAASLAKPVYSGSAPLAISASLNRILLVPQDDSYAWPRYLMLVATASGASAASVVGITRPY